jgi:hypothetical protein
MKHRILLGLLAATPLLGLAACGNDSTSTPATQPAPGTLPSVDAGYDHPTGADEVVIRIGFEGGFVTPEMTFQNAPLLLVSGDGRAFQQGPTILIYPGPLLPNIQVRTISDEGIQQLLGLADEHGLLVERTYPRDDMIADAPDTVVTFNVDGRTVEHRAYALGSPGDEADEARRALARFVADAQQLAASPVNETFGPESEFEPDIYLVRALTVGDWTGEDSLEPRLVDWPSDSSISLIGEPDCVAVPAAEFGALFESADQLTWFVEGGNTYQLLVKPQLPGDSC